MTASPHPDAPRPAAETASEIVTGISRTGQAALKDQYLKRDGHKCMISGFSDTSVFGDYCSLTECAHIIPFGFQDMQQRPPISGEWARHPVTSAGGAAPAKDRRDCTSSAAAEDGFPRSGSYGER